MPRKKSEFNYNVNTHRPRYEQLDEERLEQIMKSRAENKRIEAQLIEEEKVAHMTTNQKDQYYIKMRTVTEILNDKSEQTETDKQLEDNSR